jgi:hypothetical protein
MKQADKVIEQIPNDDEINDQEKIETNWKSL